MESLYESEIADLTSTVRSSLDDLKQSSSDDEAQQNRLRQSLTTDLNRLTLTIKQLEAEVRTSTNLTTRKALQARVKEFRKDAKSMEIEFKKQEEQLDRDHLLSQRGALGEAVSEDDRQRVLAMNEKLERSTEALQSSHRVMLDLEDSAADVSSQLRQNRETILSAHQKLKKSSTLAGQARSLLSRMENRQLRQKAAIYGIFGFVGLVLLYVLYVSILR